MESTLKLMCILPHPDDETLGVGGVLAKYAAEGVHVSLVMVTRGERGWSLDTPQPGLEELGRMREGELRCAAEALGIEEVYFLGYTDGEVAEADPQEMVERMVPYLREVRPQVVITFDPFGVYGHPDHVASGQAALAAILAAASAEVVVPGGEQPFRVQKLYYIAETEASLRLYMETMGGEIQMEIDGQMRGPVPWPEWAVTTRIEFGDYWEAVVRAISCHRTQNLPAAAFAAFPQTLDRERWSSQTLYRAFSLVNGGRALETDLFDGLR